MKSAFLCLIYALCFNCGHSTLLLPLVLPHQEIRKLGHYGADPNNVSMSGFSSGAMWSAQYHTAFSTEIMGVGMINGGPAFCAYQGLPTFLRMIECTESALFNSAQQLINVANKYANLNLIDPVGGMAGDKVFILNCRFDPLVNPGNGRQIQEYYEAFGAVIKTKFDIPGLHSMVTNEVDNLCQEILPYGLTNCDYDAAFELLNHIYGNLSEPPCNMSLNGELYRFDQSEFTAPQTPNELSMADFGYVYVPSHCKNNTGCRVHVANHGCFMGGLPPYKQYVLHGGYNDVGEANNIIIIYPQMILHVPLPTNPGFPIQGLNPFACHDWFGYTTELYAAKSAPQMQAFHNMIERVKSK